MLIFINARCSHTLPDQRMSPSRLAPGSAKKAKLGGLPSSYGPDSVFAIVGGGGFVVVVICVEKL